MKKYAMILGLLLLVKTTMAEPVLVSDGAPVTRTFRAVQMLDETTGWAVGDAGTIYKRSGPLHPTSSEAVWVSKSSAWSAWDFKGLSFVSEDTGWVVGYKRDNPGKYKGIVLWTTNGGGSWFKTTSDSIQGLQYTTDSLTPFMKVKMVWSNEYSNYTGYISCGNGYLLRTRNNGASWTKIRPTTNNSDSLTIWYNSLWIDESNPNSLWAAGDQSCSFAMPCPR
ncbi:MAG: WD40/YVTN/BNR-like repeat-containing protein [Desulfocucumaceae bacterium]